MSNKEKLLNMLYDININNRFQTLNVINNVRINKYSENKIKCIIDIIEPYWKYILKCRLIGVKFEIDILDIEAFKIFNFENIKEVKNIIDISIVELGQNLQMREDFKNLFIDTALMNYMNKNNIYLDVSKSKNLFPYTIDMIGAVSVNTMTNLICIGQLNLCVKDCINMAYYSIRAIDRHRTTWYAASLNNTVSIMRICCSKIKDSNEIQNDIRSVESLILYYLTESQHNDTFLQDLDDLKECEKNLKKILKYMKKVYVRSK